MPDLKKLVGEMVNIICTDGRKFMKYLVYDHTDASDNNEFYDVNEDSIAVIENEATMSGVLLFRSEIESIETV